MIEVNPFSAQMPIVDKEGRLTTYGVNLFTNLWKRVGGAKQPKFSMATVGNRQSVQSAVPLSGTDAGSDATINIASHSVNFGTSTVAYNSGAITGLSYTTTYYVYADDPNFEGGAVAYIATTSPNDIIAEDRYYVGSVTTPAAAAGDTGGSGGGGAGGEGGGGGTIWP